MSEKRSLAVLEILVHLSSSLPDRYVLVVADIPDNISIEKADQLCRAGPVPLRRSAHRG
jgi:hypothetical protein